MIYTFDEKVDRSKNNAAKFEEAYLHYGTNDVIPLWIADMDFKTAQPVIDVIKERAEQGIFGYTARPDEYFQSIVKWQQDRNGYTRLINTVPNGWISFGATLRKTCCLSRITVKSTYLH